MAVLLKNNAVGKFGGAVDDVTTSIPLLAGDGAKFPNPGVGDYFPITLVKDTGELEVVHCTARSGDVLTVSRGQEGTLALSFNAGERVSLRLTAQAISDMHDELQTQLDALDNTLSNNLSAPFGTRMLFQQTAAPVGWTKETVSYDNHALRLVTGSVGNGGSQDFTTAFAAGRTTSEDGEHSHTITVNAHVLTLSEIPGHVHGLRLGGGSSGPRNYISVDANNDGHSYGAEQTESAGGGAGHDHGASASTVANHSHTADFNVKYLDIILASKD